MSMIILAVRVQDVVNHKWYSWDNGSWDVNGEPKIPNNGDMYIAYYVYNQGTASHAYSELWCNGSKLGNTARGISPNEGFGLEWSGKMTPVGSASIIIRAWGDEETPSTVEFTIQGLANTDSNNSGDNSNNDQEDGQVGGGFINKQNVIIGAVTALALVGGVIYLKNRQDINAKVRKGYGYGKKVYGYVGDKAELAYNYGRYVTGK